MLAGKHLKICSPYILGEGNMQKFNWGYIRAGGKIEITNKEEYKLALPDEGKINIDINYGQFNETAKKWENKEKSYTKIEEFKEIVISICPGDVITLGMKTWDGSDVSFPVSSLKVVLADPSKNPHYIKEGDNV